MSPRPRGGCGLRRWRQLGASLSPRPCGGCPSDAVPAAFRRKSARTDLRRQRNAVQPAAGKKRGGSPAETLRCLRTKAAKRRQRASRPRPERVDASCRSSYACFRYFSNHSVISRRRRTRCLGFPLRDNSWFSPLNIHSRVSTPCTRRAVNICSPSASGQR